MKYEERYVSQASQEQFLSLSESDSSSEDEDIGSSSTLKGSSLKPIPDKSKSVNAATDKSKLMETKKETEWILSCSAISFSTEVDV